jgi:dynein heavy chain
MPGNYLIDFLFEKKQTFNILEPSARSLLHIYQVQLGKFFSEQQFSSDVQSCLMPLISASLVIWYRVVLSMLPTPSKSHYIFNLRDLSKLVIGLMQANSLVIFSKESLVNLFTHECIRVFNDRLITQTDNELFYQHLSDTVNDYFKIQIKTPYKLNTLARSSSVNQRDLESSQSPDDYLLLYGDFLKHEDRIYQPLTDWKQLTSILSDYQIRSNMTGHLTQRIVFFKEAAEHICRYFN